MIGRARERFRLVSPPLTYQAPSYLENLSSVTTVLRLLTIFCVIRA